MFCVELGLPFLLFGPRRPRLVAAAGIGALQFLIALTGNYGFFNLLTLALCLLAVDDATLGRLTRGKWGPDSGRRHARFVSRGFFFPRRFRSFC